jgi:hypothetical protein
MISLAASLIRSGPGRVSAGVRTPGGESLNYSLFNTARYARDLEDDLLRLWRRY